MAILVNGPIAKRALLSFGIYTPAELYSAGPTTTATESTDKTTTSWQASHIQLW